MSSYKGVNEAASYTTGLWMDSLGQTMLENWELAACSMISGLAFVILYSMNKPKKSSAKPKMSRAIEAEDPVE